MKLLCQHDRYKFRLIVVDWNTWVARSAYRLETLGVRGACVCSL